MLVVFALSMAFFAITVGPARADAGNPILGSIKATSVDNGDSTVTVFVRGQWNWLSHGSDCNSDRAATGVGIAWQDLNGPGTNAGTSEVERVAITGSPTGGTFKLKFGGKTTGTIPWNATAAQVDAALEALDSIGAGNVNVTGGPGPGTPWDVAFVGALEKTDVAAMTLANKSFTGGTSPNVVITTTTNGVNAVYNGYLVDNGAIRAYIGTSSATSPGGHANLQDQMVHPVDRGNQVEGYTVAGTDYPAGQSFFDPPTPDVTATGTWRGGCGRIPLTDTASNNAPGGGPNGEATGTACGNSSTACSGHPWGSWGYEKTDGAGHFGYSHTYLKTLLPDRICVNFYDVHNGGANGAGVPKSGDITVDGNGDNSIDTNAFNVNDGANCITVQLPGIKVTKTPHAQQIAPDGTATWNIRVENTGNVTLTNVHTTDAYAPDCVRTSTQIAAIAPHNSSTFAPGDFVVYSCSKAHITTADTNVVVACGTFTAADDTCDNSSATLGARSGSVIIASTEQNFVPNDSFTVSGLGSPNGSVTFKLYKDTVCTDNTKKILDQSVTVNANGTFGTTNTNDLKTLLTNASLAPATGGTYSWLVTYDDANNAQDFTIACGTEKFVVTNA
jgi:uncharacterized repeat protein (TIGR01451 family)